jgi:hypothetical protein
MDYMMGLVSTLLQFSDRLASSTGSLKMAQMYCQKIMYLLTHPTNKLFSGF